MGNSRDDFTSATKELLANRVGRRCSNPACRKLTCGANTNPEKITNIGVAAHICAAAQGGPRYDASMTPEERKSFENGIWLCQSCSKLIDTDITRYPKELLQSWKQLAEQTAILEVETTSSTPAFEKDKELVQFYLECFDRPAFQDDIYQEGRMEDFDKAIEDTLIALNTGVLRTRDGSILKQADGKSSVQNSLWREKLYTITDMLTAIRRRLKIAKKEKAYSTYGTGEDVAYCFYDRELAEWLNSTREEILKIHSKDKKIDENVDFKDIAEDTAGFTGAELANILNEAAIIATINKHDSITRADIEEAIKKVTVGLEKHSRVVSEKDKKLTAYHEAGHAVVSRYLETQNDIKEVSIIPRGVAGGYTMYKSNEDKYYISKTEMEEKLIALLGGRAAEKLVLDDISTGASNDLEVATNIARDMITVYGMSDTIGPISLKDSENPNQMILYGEKMQDAIGAEIKILIDTAYRNAQKLLIEHRDKLDAVANVLLEKEKITEKEFYEIFND